MEEDVTVTKMPPKFLGPLKGTTVIREGQRAHFETRVEPQNDATMKVRVPLLCFFAVTIAKCDDVDNDEDDDDNADRVMTVR